MANQNLWAPWRMQYMRQLDPSETPAGPATCFLCDAAAFSPDKSAQQQQAADHLVVLNDSRGLIILNRYPYTSGHLLVAPAEHLADLSDLSPKQRGDLMELTALSQQIILAAYNPQGINIGMNLGRCAGAGLPGHLHVHVVPRWSGDTNFMAVVGQIRVVPHALEQSYLALRNALTTIAKTS